MSSSSCNTNRSWFSCPCWLVWALTGLWALLSWQTYVCNIKQACGAQAPRPVVSQTVPAAAPVVTDAASVWSETSARPVVLHFKVNSDDVVEDDASAKLTSLVEYMKANGDAQIMLTGHTNVHKSQAYTNKLGLDRASAVRAMLVTMGAPQNQIFIESKGQTELAASPTTETGRYLNRRVVVSVIK